MAKEDLDQIQSVITTQKSRVNDLHSKADHLRNEAALLDAEAKGIEVAIDALQGKVNAILRNYELKG